MGKTPKNIFKVKRGGEAKASPFCQGHHTGNPPSLLSSGEEEKLHSFPVLPISITECHLWSLCVFPRLWGQKMKFLFFTNQSFFLLLSTVIHPHSTLTIN